MNKQVITTSDVAIKQVAVEIKVLKIGNKQVTLAVFRQLPERGIISLQTGELLGEAWGRVNYHVDCQDLRNHYHFHVVWQMGNELRRTIVLPWENKHLRYHSIDDDAWRNWQSSVKKLQQLDQLFIAV
jgi:hypothetical protein